MPLGSGAWFLPLRRSHSPLLWRDISSSSFELSSTCAMISRGVWMPEDLSSSSSKFETEITSFLYSSVASLRWNRPISSSSEWSKEVVSSLGAVASGGTCWKGSSFSATSSEAKNPGFVTSIWAKRWSPTLIKLPGSWKVVNKGSKLRTRWTALNYPSSLTKTSDLRTLLRSATLTKLMLGVTYLLSVK